MVKRHMSALLLIIVTLIFLPSLAMAHRTVDDNDKVVLSGNVHYNARAEHDAGAADTGLLMGKMILTLRLSPEKQASLNRLLVEQQDPASENYHSWLTPEEINTRFGFINLARRNTGLPERLSTTT